MYNFKNCIKDIVKVYNSYSEYKEKHVSITRAFMHYINSKNNLEFITYDYVKKIKKNYKDYLINNNLSLDEENNNSENSDYKNKNPEDFEESEYSSSEEGSMNESNIIKSDEDDNRGHNKINILKI